MEHPTLLLVATKVISSELDPIKDVLDDALEVKLSSGNHLYTSNPAGPATNAGSGIVNDGTYYYILTVEGFKYEKFLTIKK